MVCLFQLFSLETFAYERTKQQSTLHYCYLNQNDTSNLQNKSQNIRKKRKKKQQQKPKKPQQQQQHTTPPPTPQKSFSSYCLS